MNLEQDGLSIVCITEQAIIKGRIAPRDVVAMPEVPPAVDVPRPEAVDFVTLLDATILDHEYRIIRRVSRLALNPAFVVYFHEDETAPHLDRIKSMISAEDYEGAQGELDRFMAGASGDAEMLYLSGVVNQRLGNDDRARECLVRALGLTVDEKLRTVIKRHLERE